MSGWQNLGETILIDKPEYFFVIEEQRSPEGQSMLFMHLTVNADWTPSLAKEVMRNWKMFRQCVTCPVFAVSADNDIPKWKKFIEWLGFKFHIEGICEDGQQRLCFVHYNEKNNERDIKPEHCPADFGHVEQHGVDQSVVSGASVSHDGAFGR